MDIKGYLNKYKDISFKSSSFNEVDALIFAMLSYPKYHLFNDNKKKLKSKKLIPLVNALNYSDMSSKEVDNIHLLKAICSSNRYKGIKIYDYQSHHDLDTTKQFQAITFIFFNFVIVSFCGTDTSIVGFKEDMNMSYLDITPSEIEAISYLDKISKRCPFKKIIVVGHSKGGRLAVTASKHLKRKKKIKAIYTFDSPNYIDSFYDDEYNKIYPHINSYTPDESIIGRLINNPINAKIVKSTKKLIAQHDMSTWVIDDNHFEYTDEYSKRSTRIVNAINATFEKYSNEVKKEFIDILFNILDDLNIKELGSDKATNMGLLKTLLVNLPSELKKCDKSQRAILAKVLFGVIIDFIKE